MNAHLLNDHSRSDRRLRSSVWFLCCCCLAIQWVHAMGPGASRNYENPILPGFNPDPGFLRVGDDYFIVTSSFEYFPCFPIYQSKDLVNWRLIGNVLNRPSQISLDGIGPSDGLFSPVMRYHDGTYYLTFTMLKYTPQQQIVNYLVTAKHPSGPWSNPIVVTNDSFWRIDSSLFFDDDGRCYFTANRKYENKGEKDMGRMIVMQEYDLGRHMLVGPKYDLGAGASDTSRTTEGAHIYKKDGFYYLLVAEGGTGKNHTVTISRSRELTGPYEQCPSNPLLTHRKLTPDANEIHGVGHGEIVQTQNGEWYMALLGTRGLGLLGRETFLVPAIWPTGQWPVIAPGSGQVLPSEPRPDLPEHRWAPVAARDNFAGPELGPEWLFLRVPTRRFWTFIPQGGLRLDLQAATSAEPLKEGTPSFICKRLTSRRSTLTTKLDFSPANQNEVAGILIRRGMNSLLVGKSGGERSDQIGVWIETKNGRVLKGYQSTGAGSVFLRVEWRDETRLECSFSGDGSTWKPLMGDLDGTVLDSEAPGGVYTGTTVGIYASSQGTTATGHADFAFFECK